MPQLTARNKFSIPLESDAPADLQAAFEVYMASGGDHVVQYDTGPLGQRPVSTPAAPGKLGRRYNATDDLTGGPNGTEYIDTGTSWILAPSAINNLAVTNGKLADNAVDSRVLADGAVDTPAILDANVSTAKLAAKAVDTTKLADALKPSAGAGAATEALRALGVAAGQALPGNDSRLSAGAAGVETVRAIGVTGTTAAAGNDARLTDQRVPTDGSVTAAKLAADAAGQWRNVAFVLNDNWQGTDTALHLLNEAGNQTGNSTANSAGFMFYLDPADYALGAKSVLWRLRYQIAIGVNNPAQTLAFFMHRVVQNTAGGFGGPGVDISTVRISGTPVTLAANNFYNGVTGAIVLPAAEYVGISAAQSAVSWPGSPGAAGHFKIWLQVRAQ